MPPPPSKSLAMVPSHSIDLMNEEIVVSDVEEIVVSDIEEVVENVYRGAMVEVDVTATDLPGFNESSGDEGGDLSSMLSGSDFNESSGDEADEVTSMLPYLIFVRTPLGDRYEIWAGPFETIFTVKVKIQNMTGLSPHQQVLIWAFEFMQDHMTLASQGMVAGSTMLLLVR